MQDFRRLMVYRRAHALAVDVRKLTGTFPRSGYGSLKDQMIRAAETIPFNIAEGCGARTRKDFAKFLDIAIKSACELEAELTLASDYGIVRDANPGSRTHEVVAIRRMLCGLRSRVLDSPGE